MRKTLTLLVASTALTAAVGLPAWSAMHAPADGSPRSFTAIFEDAAQALPFVLASDDDDDDDDERGYRENTRRGHDDDHDDDDCDDDDDDDDDDDEHGEDDDDCGDAAANAAPAGTVEPPQNGLFATGAAPQVQVN